MHPRTWPILPPDSIFYVIAAIDPEKYAELKARLAATPRQTLEAHYRKSLRARDRKAVWSLAEEFTRRGIPPAFRPSPWFDKKLLVPEEDIVVQDLHWIATHYPHQPMQWASWRRMLKPTQFVNQAMWVMKTGIRQPGFYVKALRLTLDQQTECQYMQSQPVRKRMSAIDAVSDDAREWLRVRHLAKPRARAQGNWEPTVKRRHEVWRCGSMADWQPQRTAELYTILTGKPMTRSLASKIIDEVWAGYPESKPAAARRRRRRTVDRRRAALGRGTKAWRGRKSPSKRT